LQSKEQFEMVAKTFKGLESVLANELHSIGARNIKLANRAVIFEGDNSLMYKANFFLRTALKVLVPVYTFQAKSDKELYEGAISFQWDEWFDVKNTFAVESVINSTFFNHSQFVALKVKDAIADFFRHKNGRRPNVNPENPDFQIHIHISNDECTLLFDSSGEALYKRGYRQGGGPAPLNEVLAAGMIMLSGWKGESNFIDPMCGSGTLPIEAGLIAYDIPPGIFRKKFGFEHWKDFDEEMWINITESYTEKNRINGQIHGSDKLQGVVALARRNAASAFLSRKIELRVSNLEEYDPPEGPGIVMINPPYGKRIREIEINSLYTIMGDIMKKRFAGYEAWILSNNFESIKHIGLRPEKKITLFNGPLECRFLKYSLYEGTLKSKTQ
jgi:putative N6-adenine-specific DNA methylase